MRLNSGIGTLEVHQSGNNLTQSKDWRSVTILFWLFIGIAGFEIGYHFEPAWFFATLLPLSLTRLAEKFAPSVAFRAGFVMGIALYGKELFFFTNIFSYGAIALWAVLSLWLALFALAVSSGFQRLRRPVMLTLIPFLWTGFEFARSELYPLKFTWIIPGYSMDATGTGQHVAWLGVYGIGFLLAAIASVFWWANGTKRWQFSGLALVVFVLVAATTPRLSRVEVNGKGLNVAGIHLPSESTAKTMNRMDAFLARHPDTQLVVLAEYTFGGEPDPEFREWCVRHNMYLVAGGMEHVDGGGIYNTAFVIGPTGEIVFKQAKSVPLQFFDDGLPAKKQEIWESPWGKVGVAICYDLSYRMVMDRLIKQGSQLLVIPTMDELSWGEQEHRHHARVALTRAAEYQVSIARVGSVGISQLVAPGGLVVDSTEFPGEAAEVAGVIPIVESGRTPIDALLAPLATGLTGLVLMWLFALFLIDSFRNRRHARSLHSSH